MCYKNDLKEYSNMIDDEFSLLNATDRDDVSEIMRIRENIMFGLKQSCRRIICGVNDPNNEVSKKAASFLECLDGGYDICLVIDLRNFIYTLLL